MRSEQKKGGEKGKKPCVTEVFFKDLKRLSHLFFIVPKRRRRTKEQELEEETNSSRWGFEKGKKRERKRFILEETSKLVVRED